MASEGDVDAGPDAASASPPVARPAGTDLSWPVFVALLATLAIDAALAATIAVLDTGYGQGAGHLLGLGLWIVVAIINAFAVWNVLRRRRRWFANVLLAQVLALIMAVYVLWVDEQSPDPGSPARWVGLVVALVAGAWIALLVLRAPGSSAHAFGTSWRVVAAAFSLLGIFSIWLQTSYLPSTERPMVDMATSLSSEASTPTTTVLKVDITLHNRGLANAVIVGSLYRVTYTLAGPLLPFTGPVSGVQVFSGNDLDLARPARHTTPAPRDDTMAQAFDFTGPNTDVFQGSAGDGGTLVQAGQIDSMREFLLPGQTWSTEAVVRVPTAYAATVRLTAQVALITDRYLGDTRACQPGAVDERSSGFLAQARHVNVVLSPTPAGSSPSTTSTTLSALGPTSTLSIPGQEGSSAIGDSNLVTNTTVGTSAFGAEGPSSTPDTSGAAARRIDYLCVQTSLTPQSAVQNLVGDHPNIRTYYVLADGDPGSFDELLGSGQAPGTVVGDVPYLVNTFQNGSGSSRADSSVHATQAIDAQNPSAVIESRSEYGIPGSS